MKLNKSIISWCMYDWANSSFAVVVLTAFYPVLFKTFWDIQAHSAVNTARLGLGNTIAGTIAALLSPLIGAFADASHGKKTFLGSFIILGVSMTAGLFFVGQGQWAVAIALFVLANIGFTCANLFYDSLLVDIVPENEMDFVSSWGYAVGYIGGGIVLVVDIVVVLFWQRIGLPNQAFAMRVAFASVAIWWFLFSLPILFFVREAKNDPLGSKKALILDSMRRLKGTVLKIANDKLLVFFIIAFWLYMDGVYTVITMAVNFGMSIGIDQRILLITIVLVQFIAFFASIGFAYLSKYIGAGSTILCGIAIYILVCTIGFLILKTSGQYMFLASLVAIAQGGVQALSRSYFAKIVPADDSAEYFGFLNLISRFSIIIGPLLVGQVTLLLHFLKFSDSFSSRLGMSSIIIVFIGGAILLVYAEKERKRRKYGEAAR